MWKCFKCPANGTAGVIFSENKCIFTGWNYAKSGLGTVYGMLGFLNNGTYSVFIFTLLVVLLTTLNFLAVIQQFFCPLPFTIALYIGKFGKLALKASG